MRLFLVSIAALLTLGGCTSPDIAEAIGVRLPS
jgi:uncharacterized protein YceK